MASPVVASTTTFADTTNQTSRNLAFPASIAAGDWLVVGVAIDLTATINTPGGFAEVYARADSDSSSNMKVFKRKADGAETGNITISTSNEIACGFCARITGADSADCVDVCSDWSGSPDTQSSEDVGTYPPVYAASGDSLILRITGWDDGGTTITNPSGHTEIANVGAASSGAKLQACYKTRATAGLEPATGFGVSDTTELGSAVSVVIRSTATPAPPPAQPYFRCGSFFSSDASTNTAITYQKPYGTADGDLLLLVQTSDAASNLSPPGTFTSIQDANNGSAVYHQAYYRVASSEGGTYTGSTASTNAKLGALLRVVNAHASAPINTSSAATGTSASPTASTVTPSVDNCTLLFTMGCDDDEVAFASGAPTGFDNIWSVSTEEGLDVGLIVAKDEQTTAGATGPISTSITASEEWVAFAIAIAPAASSGVTVNPNGTSGTGSAGTPAATGTASAVPTGLSSTGSAGAPTAGASETVTLTGQSVTGSAGSPAVTGTASIPLTGQGATGNVGTPTASVSESTALSGQAATGAVGAPSITGTASTALAGHSSTGAVGSPSVSIDISTALTGSAATGAAGEVAVNTGAADATGELTGPSATGSIGTPTATGGASDLPTGRAATGQIGTPTVTGTAAAEPAGLSASGGIGVPNATGDAASALTGLAGTGAVGVPVATGGAPASATGLAATGATGTPTATSSAEALLNGLAATAALGSPGVSGTALASQVGFVVTGSVGALEVVSLTASGLNIVAVAVESRVVTVAASTRPVEVANDNRVISAPATSRTVTVTAQSRAIPVAA